MNGLKYNGDETNLAREISNGVSINLLTNGNSVMNAQGAGKDLGTFFNELVADFDKHDEASISDLSKKLGEVTISSTTILASGKSKTGSMRPKTATTARR